MAIKGGAYYYEKRTHGPLQKPVSQEAGDSFERPIIKGQGLQANRPKTWHSWGVRWPATR